MINKRKYLIRTSKNNCSIESDGKSINFVLSDMDNKPTIKFDTQISNFLAYEYLLKQQLEKVGLKSLPWNKNILYLSIPNELTQVQMRCFFDFADHADASECYLLKENIALLHSRQLKDLQNEFICILGIYDTKIEFSVMHELGFKFLKTLYADTEILQKLDSIHDIIDKYLRIINTEFSIKKFFIINESQYLDSQTFEAEGQFISIENKNDLIMEGLKIASEKDIPQLCNRLKI